MSKRNFTLLAIILGLVVGLVLLYLYLNRGSGGVDNGDGDGSNFISDFNPFGNSKDVDPKPGTPNNGTGDEDFEEEPLNSNIKLTKVSTMPVAGFGIFSKERYKEVAPVMDEQETTPTAPTTEFVPAVRYTEKANGNIYQTFADKIEERKFTSTIIPRIHEAFFGAKAESVVMRYLKADDRTIETFVGVLPKEVLGGDTSNTNEIKGAFLPQNITDLSTSYDGSKMFYLFNSNNSSVGITAGSTGDKKTQVFDSAFTEWLSSWINANTISLTTKPSSLVPGYMYKINPATKSFTQVLGNINGLTTLMSPDGKMVLYSDGAMSMNIYNTETREAKTIAIKGLPDKCTWSQSNKFIYCASPKLIYESSYPDVWYKGEISFSDSFWLIDVENGNTNLILDPITMPGGEEVDGIKLQIDPTEKYLFFVNKKDSFLWEITLK